MWLEIVKSNLTKKAKSLLISKYINRNITVYKEVLTHDGNIGEYFESDIYTLIITFYENNKTYKHTYTMEQWFSSDYEPDYMLESTEELG